MIGVNGLRRVAILSFVLTSIVYSQESDSLLIRNYKEYKNGVFNDSALSILYRHGLISKEMYLSKKYGKMPLTRDAMGGAPIRCGTKAQGRLPPALFVSRTGGQGEQPSE